jgi:hypothetical protein
MPEARVFEKKEVVKKEKGTMSKYEYDIRKAEKDRAAKAARLEAAEEARARAAEHELARIKAANARDPLPSELSDEHDDDMVAKVIAKAMGIPYTDDTTIEEVRDRAFKIEPDVVDMDISPRQALIEVTEVIAARKAAKAEKVAFMKKLKEEELEEKKAQMAKAKADKEAKAKEASRLAAEKKAAEKAAIVAANSIAGAQAEFGCVNKVIGDVSFAKPLTKEEKKEAAKKARAEKLAAREKAGKQPRGLKAKKEKTAEEIAQAEKEAFAKESGIDDAGFRDVVVTGVLTSNPAMRDIQYENFSLTFQGQVLVKDTKLALNYGRRYGLLGLNGSGKSTLLCAIGQREVDIPEHMDMYHLVSEVPASDHSAMDIVVSCDKERADLEKRADELSETGQGIEDGQLDELYEHCSGACPVRITSNPAA